MPETQREPQKPARPLSVVEQKIADAVIPKGTIARYAGLRFPNHSLMPATGSASLFLGNSYGKGVVVAICLVAVAPGVAMFRCVVERPGGHDYFDISPTAVLTAELIDGEVVV